MKIQIFGTGCSKCKKLVNNAEVAAQELGIEYELEKVTDINKIISAGIMMTPGITIDGVVKASGKLCTVKEIKAMLKVS